MARFYRIKRLIIIFTCLLLILIQYLLILHLVIYRLNIIENNYYIQGNSLLGFVQFVAEAIYLLYIWVLDLAPDIKHVVVTNFRIHRISGNYLNSNLQRSSVLKIIGGVKTKLSSGNICISTDHTSKSSGTTRLKRLHHLYSQT
ncbi:Hypothetical_protein [Hexamita inflata]|uniref:Hypothetical_protein n=1 Tax=Hexamita inflata TaxID=28002 RepID=A0AA86P7W1_9EUKA|nr:Hypothetical protein HINF_LOCUS20228 [Hexamita inflata]